MNLTIPFSTKDDINGFIKFLIFKIQKRVENSLDNKELSRWDDYFFSNNLGWPKHKNKKIIPSTRDVILGSIYNLTYNKYPDKYIIYTDPNVNINNSSIKYSTLIEMIDKGNLSIRGYPILSRAFNYIVDNIKYLYLMYKEGE